MNVPPNSPAALALPQIKESKLILVAGLIQFVNIIDFMMVMPLGPDFSRDLGIPLSDIGLIGGSYAFAAAIAGLIASFFIDRYARKRAILFFLGGLCIATLGGAVAWDRNSMVAARLIAGIFGGPLASLSIALIADYIPPERRGAAMGKVMGAFSAASVIGLPFGLELARLISWHAPFIATSIAGCLVLFYSQRNLPYHPPFSGNTTLRRRVAALRDLLRSKIVLLSYLLVFVSMCAAFVMIPNMTPHLLLNWHYPRANLGWLYFVGGLVTFFTMRGAGVLIDRVSASFVSLLATVLFIIIMLIGFIYYPGPLPVMLVFVGFMLSMTTRNICGQALFSKIPSPEHRGAYTALQTSLVHMTQALAAYGTSFILVEQNGQLLHMAELGWIAIGFSVPVPILFYYIERHLKRVN